MEITNRELALIKALTGVVLYDTNPLNTLSSDMWDLVDAWFTANGFARAFVDKAITVKKDSIEISDANDNALNNAVD